MKFCSHCGKELADAAVVCPACGCAQSGYDTSKSKDSSNAGYGVLGFCIPIVGLILWLIWKDEYPLRAKSTGTGALIGGILMVVFWIIYFFIVGAAMVSVHSYY